MFKRLFKKEKIIYDDFFMFKGYKVLLNDEKTFYEYSNNGLVYRMYTGEVSMVHLEKMLQEITEDLDAFDEHFKEAGGEDIIGFINSLEIDFEEELTDSLDLIEGMSLIQVRIYSNDHIEFIYTLESDSDSLLVVEGAMDKRLFKANLEDISE